MKKLIFFITLHLFCFDNVKAQQPKSVAEYIKNRVEHEVSRLYHVRSFQPHVDKWRGLPYRLLTLNPVFAGSNEDGYVYLNKTERQQYKIYFKNGRLLDSSGRELDTRGTVGMLYVMDRYGDLYATKRYRANRFEHHSLVAGESVVAAGRMVIHLGRIKILDDYSGQYPSRNFYPLTKVVTKLRGEGVWNNKIKVLYRSDSKR